MAYFVLFISGFLVLNIVLGLVINVCKSFLSERSSHNWFTT